MYGFWLLRIEIDSLWVKWVDHVFSNGIIGRVIILLLVVQLGPITHYALLKSKDDFAF